MDSFHLTAQVFFCLLVVFLCRPQVRKSPKQTFTRVSSRPDWLAKTDQSENWYTVVLMPFQEASATAFDP